MVSKSVLMEWVIEALEDLGGSAEVLDVSKKVWAQHEADIVAADDLFYTWQ